MKNEQKEDREPLIENEAIKNSDRVAEDKMNKNLTTNEELPAHPHICYL